MTDTIDIPSALGRLILRPETAADREFRYRLFCDSRLPEWYQAGLPSQLFEQLMQHQFTAQSASYPLQFPKARFDIIELDDAPIGRIAVNRPGHEIHIIDQAIVPEQRNRGLGSAVMRALMEEAAAAGVPVRLQVASTNDPSMRLYLKLGFERVSDDVTYINLTWCGG